MRVRGAPSALPLVVIALLGCGRTGLWQFTDEEGGGRGGSGGTAGAPPVDECTIDADCVSSGDLCVVPRCREEGRARVCVVEAISCDDADVCTLDACDPVTGACVHEAPTDADGDGFVGAAPRDVPVACGGDDCDDEEPSIHPGAAESCDGVDQNCNGIIDDGATYVADRAMVRLAPAAARSTHGGIAFDGHFYGATFRDGTDSDHALSYFALFDGGGNQVGTPAPVSLINASTFAGPVATSGDGYLTAWADARQANNYEIYATRFNAEGAELQADLRLTNALDFSLRPTIQWTGTEYLVVWEDHRTDDDDGLIRVYGRRLSKGGAMIGDETVLSSPYESGQYPAFALGKNVVGITYTVLDPILDETSVMFRTTDFSFENASQPIALGSGGQEPNVVWVGDRFVVSWHTGHSGAWGNTVVAAAVDEKSSVLQVGPVTSGDAIARLRTLVSLGDRVVLVWMGAGPGARYDLFYEILDPDLNILQPREQLTSTVGDSVDPIAVLGPDGDIAVVFDENAPPNLDAYFVRLRCQIIGLE